MIDYIKTFQKVIEDACFIFSIIKGLRNIACRLWYCMLSWMIYLKTKLNFVKDIVIWELFMKAIIPNTLNYFGKKRNNIYWTIIFGIFFFIVKYWWKRGKTGSSKILYDFYRIVEINEINNNAAFKIIGTNDLVLSSIFKTFLHS